jgi:hypothetical protein
MREVFINFTRMNRASLTHKLEQQLRSLSVSPSHRGILSRVHQRIQRARNVPVVDETIFFDVERGIAPFEFAGFIILHSMAEDQILRACRRSNRISLNEAHLVQCTLQRSWTEEVASNSVTPQIIDSDRVRRPVPEIPISHPLMKAGILF